jgi:Domain of unknown function (DUF4340)
MKARARTAVATLALAGLAGGALLYAWYGVEKKGEAEAKGKEKAERLFAFEPGDVRELRVEAKGGSTRLVREPGGWRIPALGEQADGSAVEAMLERLAHVRRRAEVAPAPDEAALVRTGLARPRVRVEASLEGGRKESLSLGDKSTFDGSLYVRTGAGPVFAVPADVEWPLDKGTEDLRDRTLLRFDQEQVQALRVEENGKLAWAVERRPARDGAPAGWALTAPRSAPAQAGKVGSALQSLSWTRALRFADDSGKRAAELGLVRPRRAFVLLGEGGKEMGRVEVGKEAHDSAYARSSASPRILEVDKSAFSGIPASAGEVEDQPAPPKAEARSGGGGGAPAPAPAAPGAAATPGATAKH